MPAVSQVQIKEAREVLCSDSLRWCVDGKQEFSEGDEVRISDGTETILLVEDDEVVRKLISKVLGNEGYRLLEAANGVAALSICAQYEERIHLLLTDVIMPGMNGRDLADRLVPQYPEMKVLFMSGYTDDVIVHHGVLDEGTAFIQKPFAPDVLARKVREVLGDPGKAPEERK
jgi:CheY-like chemotaxis protein